MPVKIKIFNVIQNELPVSILMSLDPSSQVILDFDISHLWAKRPPEGFRFITQGSVKVKQ